MSNNKQQELPEFVASRLAFFHELQDRTPVPESEPITVTLMPFNCEEDCEPIKEIPAVAGVTKASEILKNEFPKTLAVACLTDGEMWDLNRPLVKSCRLSFLNFDCEKGKEVFWHSSAHVLGAAIELQFHTEIAIGPATENGFFYDFEPKEDMKIDASALSALQKRCQTISKKKADFERKMITREEALELFRTNKYKLDILTNRIQPGELVNVYRTGTFIDLCRGPHVTTASIMQNWWLMDTSQSCWNGQLDKKLIRVRGTTFPTKEGLKAYKTFLEEAAKRDHRKLGVDYDLFFFHPWSPGCAFFYPKGAWIYNKLIDVIQDEYHKRGFNEVITPNLFYEDLFKTSGHWQHYRGDMFHFKEDPDNAIPQETAEGCPCCQHREMGLKPMNCPGHCLVFRSKCRSYKELPMRMAEFGVIHRNEATGALSGLTRVRRFVQDDAHIFCRRDQIFEEIRGALDFIKVIYERFGLEYDFELSTINMEKYMGDLAVWEEATDMLRRALIEGEFKFKEQSGEAAFYGPKIDIHIKDCLGRRHQLATIQLDFQLPEKFDLKYLDAQGNSERPVMIHRAILGSIERFIAIIVEHYAAKFPFWMNPQQIVIVPQNTTVEAQVVKSQQLMKLMHDECFNVEIDDGPHSMNKKILNALKGGAGVVLVVGNNEVENDTITARWRGMNKGETMPLVEFMDLIRKKRDNFE